MPRLPEPRTPAFRELARQLRFQPPDASQRQLGRAEELALQLLAEYEPTREWPVEWVVFRVTGYRSEQRVAALSGTIRGRELLHDLSVLIQLLGAAVNESESALRDSEPSRWLTVEELCRRWHVSRQTLDRYRTLGLFSRRVTVPRSRGRRTPPQRALFDLRAVEAFERTHAEALRRAGAFSRIDGALGDRLHRRASRYHRLLGWSLTRVAHRLSERVGRSPGAVRRAILDAERRLGAPIFRERRPVRAGGRDEAVREFRRGGSARTLAQTTGRSRASVYRMAASERARRLRELPLAGPARPDFATPGNAEKLLATPAATQGLGRPLPHTLAELIEQANATEPAATREKSMGAAYALLRYETARAIASLGPAPTILPPTGKAARKSSASGFPAAGIDWIETRLRWASRIKAELVRSQLGLLLRTVESQLGRPLASFPGAIAVDIVASLAAALFDAADRYDPFKGGRLAAPAGLALNRAAARWAEQHPRELAPPAARPLARPAPSHARLDHVWMAMTPWTTWLEPPPVVRQRVDEINPRSRAVLIARFGWDARPPRTVPQAAAELGLSPVAIIRTERAAMRQLL